MIGAAKQSCRQIAKDITLFFDTITYPYLTGKISQLSIALERRQNVSRSGFRGAVVRVAYAPSSVCVFIMPLHGVRPNVYNSVTGLALGR